MRGEGIIPVMDVNGNNGNNGFGGFGGDGWAWIIVLFLIFGWGNGRNGFGGNNDGALTRNDLCQDMNFNDLQNALRSSASENNSNFRGVDNAICQIGYQTAQLASGIDMNIANGFSRLDTSLCQSFNNVAQQVNSLSSQISNCCCENLRALDNVMFTNQKNTCDITNAINGVYNQLHNEIVANRIEDKNAQITAQQNEINSLRLSASQAQQNEYLLNQLRTGCPVNAQLVCGNTPIPVQYIGAYGNNCGCGNY